MRRQRLFRRARVALLAGVAIAASVTAAAGMSGASEGLQDRSGPRWYRGNTHTHTDRSDGNAPPLAVARRYRELGYDFVVISDHDQLTPVAALQQQLGDDGRFLVIQGEEVSALHEGRAVHVNGLGLDAVVPPRGGATVTQVIERNIAAVRDAGGIAHLNHPNYGWFMTADDIAAVDGLTHLELLNPHPVNNTYGGGGWPSTEQLWDDLLSRGLQIYGIAADDAHDYDAVGIGRSDRGPAPHATPGLAWIMVRAERLDPSSILGAIDSGDFYATTGVELEAYEVTDDAIHIRLPRSYRYRIDVPGELRYVTQFIGGGGRILHTDESAAPVYRRGGEEAYVRARVRASDGTFAWTQPVFRPDQEN